MIIAAVSSMAVVRPKVRRKPVLASVSDDCFPIAILPTGRISALDHSFEQPRGMPEPTEFDLG